MRICPHDRQKRADRASGPQGTPQPSPAILWSLGRNRTAAEAARLGCVESALTGEYLSNKISGLTPLRKLRS
jgi:hypothetical protein